MPPSLPTPVKRLPKAGAKDGTEAMKAYAVEVARKYGLDENVFLKLVEAESNWNSQAESPVGAYGLTQLMPGTAQGLGVDVSDWRQQLEGGAKYLAQQVERFGSYTLGLAAYNAGPGNVEKYKGVPPFAETENYIGKILGSTGKVYKEPSGVVNYGGKNGVVDEKPKSTPHEAGIFATAKRAGEAVVKAGTKVVPKPYSYSSVNPSYTPTGKYDDDMNAYLTAAERAWAKLDAINDRIVQVGEDRIARSFVGYQDAAGTFYKDNPPPDAQEVWAVDPEATKIAQEALHWESQAERLEQRRKAGLTRSGDDAAKAYVESEKDKAKEADRKYNNWITRVKDLQALEDLPTARAMSLAQALEAANSVNSKRYFNSDPLATVAQPHRTNFAPQIESLRRGIGEAPADYSIDFGGQKQSIFGSPDPSVQIPGVPYTPTGDFDIPNPAPGGVPAQGDFDIPNPVPRAKVAPRAQTFKNPFSTISKPPKPNYDLARR